MRSVPEAVDDARRLAEDLLLPTALETDAAPLVPRSHLDALARAGLYGLAGPIEAGGTDADLATVCSVIEALASGCLATAFVFVQHHGVVRAVAHSDNDALREAWLGPLCAGTRRAGIALAALRPGPPSVTATRVDGGWRIDGRAPWVTGWGLVDVVSTAARTSDGEVVWSLVDAADAPSLRALPLALVAASSSGTVELTYDGLVVPHERVFAITPYTPPPPYDGGGRVNGSLSLGVVARCCALLGPSPLDEMLIECRARLDAASDETMADARAAATALASRATARLVVALGSSSALLSSHGQRLAREAIFLLVFGSRPAIRASLLERL